LLSNDPSMGLRSAMSVPDQYISGQKAISEMKEKQRQRGEVSSFLEQYAPTPFQAGQQSFVNAPTRTSTDYGPSPQAAQRQIDRLNAPIDFNRALLDSLRLSGNPAQPQIRETLAAMQPKFQGDLRVDASGRIVGALPTTKDGIQTQYNTATGQYAANPVQNYMMSQLMTKPPTVSTDTMLVPVQGGGFIQQAIPGAANAVQTIKAAEAVGQAAGQVEQVVGADGKTYYVPRSSLLTQPPKGGTTGTTPVGWSFRCSS
jgi:hypothetical protein